VESLRQIAEKRAVKAFQGALGPGPVAGSHGAAFRQGQQKANTIQNLSLPLLAFTPALISSGCNAVLLKVAGEPCSVAQLSSSNLFSCMPKPSTHSRTKWADLRHGWLAARFNFLVYGHIEGAKR
jgi:hypothetical protein